MQLAYTSNEPDPFKVEWLSDNPKVVINKDTGLITNLQTGSRTANITLNLTDSYGTIVTDKVKITFYKFFWEV